jgi:hypothetical protein
VAMLLHWFMRGRQEWETDRELDRELRRAQIERLRGGARTEAPTKAE